MFYESHIIILLYSLIGENTEFYLSFNELPKNTKYKLEISASFKRVVPEVYEYNGKSASGKDGKINYYNVPKGEYKLLKLDENGNEIKAESIKVDGGKMTTVAF